MTVWPDHPVLDRLRPLLPGIAARADEIEAARRLPADLARTLIGTKVFKLCVPKAVGGEEAHPLVLMQAIEETAAADGSAGWNVAIGASSGSTAAYLAPDVARLIHGAPEAVTGGIFAPRGKAVREGDGYRVTGHWQWASGSPHCAWIKGGCVAYEDGKPRLIRDGVPEVLTVYFPRDKIEFVDNWYTSGLCGTASCDIKVTDVFVPAAHTISLTRDKPRVEAPLYVFPMFGLLGMICAMTSLGIARGAITDIVELAGAKKPTLSNRALAERGATQGDIARAEAILRGARAFMVEAILDAWAEAEAGAISVARRAALRLAATHAANESARVVDICYTLGGGTAVYRNSPLQRRFRDAHVITQHMMVAPPSYELAGRVLLGLPTDPSMI
ncbi:MAG: flavin-dependent monooxygenase [Rhodospirillales bacterium]|nr:MAG: flavin-dependent monooxygenase [Rhodospirillales bacterium]